MIDSAPGIESTLYESIQKEYPKWEKPDIDISKFLGPPVLEVIRILLPDQNNKVIERVENHFRIIYDETGWKKPFLYPGVSKLLAWLFGQQKRIYLVTNKPIIPATKIMGEFGIVKYFQNLYTPDSSTPVFQNKTEMIRDLLHSNQLENRSTIMVGDTITDAQAAQDNQIDLAFAGYGYGDLESLQNIQPVCILNDPCDLYQFIMGEKANE